MGGDGGCTTPQWFSEAAGAYGSVAGSENAAQVEVVGIRVEDEEHAQELSWLPVRRRPRMRALRGLTVAGTALTGAVLMSSLGACGSTAHPDERATATTSIKTVIANLNGTGDIVQSSPVAVGSCSAHRAVAAWQAKLTARALQLAATDRSFQLSAVFVAHIGRSFTTTPSVRQADSYETQAAADKAGTVLIFTVPGGEYVRIDGVIAC